MCCLLTYSFECWFAKGQCKSYIHSTQKSVRRSKPRIEQSFPCSSVGKEPACNAGDLGSIPWSGRPPGEGNGNPNQDSCLEKPMDRGAWKSIVHEVSKRQTRLSD